VQVSAQRYRVLGANLLQLQDRTLTPERKTAAVLTYLALEGPTTRSKLAGLLWPDAPEGTARNNLSQTLRRLRGVGGDGLIGGDDPLQLSPELRVDAAELRVRAFSGEAEGVLELAGELLGTLDYDDLPEFADWLYGEREALLELRRGALWTLIGRAENAGEYGDAVRWARRLLDLDPVSEASHRALMRVYYLAGDRPAALRAYGRCKEVLAREFGTQPLPETLELARKIDQGLVRAPRRARAERTLPAFVLRPPVLVGREAEWAEMERAWAAGQTIYLTGDPGVGKTRLAQEFVASKGRGLYLPSRPGVQDVPFAGAVALARARLAAAPTAELPGWVARELSRILPELREDDEPPPLRGEDDRLRFFQAYFEMVRLTGVGFVATISDDVQYYDQATTELGGFLMSQPRSSRSRENIPRYVVVYRRGELPSATQAFVDRLVASEIAVSIAVAPLDVSATGALLGSLGLEGVGSEVTPPLAEAVFRRTGGNALFILETLRHLIETDRLGATLPAQLPLPSRVGTMIRGRLGRLSEVAQRVVKAAAVLQSDFDLELVGAILHTDPLELIGAWEELEGAQVFSGARFSHDLLLEAALESVSQPVKVLLNRRCAVVLAARRADPARIAGHWFAAGDELAAVPALRAAALRAVDELRLADAENGLEQARAILARHGRDAEAAEVAAEKGALLEVRRG
jgi:DNA-binding SARP family transcriptional activator